MPSTHTITVMTRVRPTETDFAGTIRDEIPHAAENVTLRHVEWTLVRYAETTFYDVGGTGDPIGELSVTYSLADA